MRANRGLQKRGDGNMSIDMNFERLLIYGGWGEGTNTQILVIEYRLNFKHFYTNNPAKITRNK